ncbi:MAG: 2-succinyl-5-enolpyruvyl-6-hydroxy-3-cyclohexene-1-carboxylic-acid synthase [Puniceicoccaceae bacterium]|nr:MAG: 2-succinyl-5-enolpyruvyl-6-hydroxy-3-cyclohexene-1-carboxylic-acid synthase [Puniceicoccaceae bacterium]
MNSLPQTYPNINALWGSVLGRTLAAAGLREAVICPGSRSAPLVFGLTGTPGLECIPVIDERSAGFFALGRVRAGGRPVALVCTSGTAAANFLPAVIEARESGLPLLVLTADRPPELRDCRAGQAIDQGRIYGDFTVWRTELPLPEAAPGVLRALRQTLVHAWDRCRRPVAGPVQINCPFRDPLVPVERDGGVAWPAELEPDSFFELGEDFSSQSSMPSAAPKLPDWAAAEDGLIVVGPHSPENPAGWRTALARIARNLGWPVLADPLSPLRGAGEVPYRISGYDPLVRSEAAETLRPSFVLQVGPLPTSKVFREKLEAWSPPGIALDAEGRNPDPLHRAVRVWPAGVEAFARGLPEAERAPSPFARRWLEGEAAVTAKRAELLAEAPYPFPGRVAWELGRRLPAGTPVFCASSMPVRDLEFFLDAGDSGWMVHANRGANGIDGTLSTALGIAHHGLPAVLLTGDLAFLHDSNGLLLGRRLAGGLTVVLINNGGGGIFEILPVAKFDPPFTEFFATPQAVDFAALAKAHGVQCRRPESWEALGSLLAAPVAEGIRIVELVTDRKRDAGLYRRYLRALGAAWAG